MQTTQTMRIILARPRGFCAGVEMAVQTLELALQRLSPPIYVYHEIVHNKHVVQRFRGRGVIFVDDLVVVPPGATVIFSAHGVSPAVRTKARERRLRKIDATCPLVTKVHLEAIRFAEQGYRIVLIGHRGHDEVEGTVGEVPAAIHLVESVADVERLNFPPDQKLAYLMQTTLSVDDARRIVERLRARFPDIVGPAKDDICYATQNRQDAVRRLAERADVVLVVGSQNSSNSQRLREVAAQHGARAFLIDGPAELDLRWFGSDDTVVITAGASAPEDAVQAVVQALQENFRVEMESDLDVVESQHFPLPKELRSLASATA